MHALTKSTKTWNAAVGGCTLLALASLLMVTPADARVHHRRHDRVLLVRSGGLIPGTYPADYGTPGYGCRTSILVGGNFGGCGFGWAYEGGPGWGYR